MEFDPTAAQRMLALETGAVCGLLAGMSVQIILGSTDVHIAAAWNEVFVSRTGQFRSALAWWLIAGSAIVAGFIAAIVARMVIMSRGQLRGLGWLLGAALVAGLVVVGGLAHEPTDLEPGIDLAANLAGMAVALVGACIGAAFAARR